MVQKLLSILRPMSPAEQCARLSAELQSGALSKPEAAVLVVDLNLGRRALRLLQLPINRAQDQLMTAIHPEKPQRNKPVHKTLPLKPRPLVESERNFISIFFSDDAVDFVRGVRTATKAEYRNRARQATIGLAVGAIDEQAQALVFFENNSASALGAKVTDARGHIQFTKKAIANVTSHEIWHLERLRRKQNGEQGSRTSKHRTGDLDNYDVGSLSPVDLPESRFLLLTEEEQASIIGKAVGELVYNVSRSRTRSYQCAEGVYGYEKMDFLTPLNNIRKLTGAPLLDVLPSNFGLLY